MLGAISAPPSAHGSTANDLFDLSIEELVNLEVTSVSRKAERLADTTSAVYVITQDDIQRHGIRSIPEALRLAPGLSVQQIDANKWAIGARGFSGRFANKLLVLMDGRALYTPSFSGVFWDVQSTLIEEIDRIEVIRGPGSTVWGSNAVNGVINIITRSSNAVDGGSIIGGLDPEGARFAAGRYGGELGDKSTYRGFVQYQEGVDNQLQDGSDANDNWDLFRASLRTDTVVSDAELAVVVEGYTGTMGLTQASFSPVPPFQSAVPGEDDVRGGFLLTQWTVPHSETSKSSGQISIDYSDRESLLYSEERTTFNVEVRHQRVVGGHELIFGGGARLNQFNLGGSDTVVFTQEIDENFIVNAFLQDDIALVDDALSLTLGVKLENNDLSPRDIEVMPTARLSWKPAEAHTAWAAITRAVRTPAIADLASMVRDIGAPLPPGDPNNPFPVPLRQGTLGNPDFESEVNVAFEVGMRGQWTKALSYDVALYAMEYERLRTLVPADVLCLPAGVSALADPFCVVAASSVVSQLAFSNDSDGYVRGGELELNWQVQERWRLRGAISYANERLDTSFPAVPIAATGPKWQANFRSEWTPLDSLSVAAWLRYVDEIPYQDIDDYWQANVHVRWQYQEGWVVALGVRNLLDDATDEYQSEFGDVVPTQIERSAYLNVRYSF
ncbi:MAG: TonB-dependent receptor [Pseudomonadota bacterium]